MEHHSILHQSMRGVVALLLRRGLLLLLGFASLLVLARQLDPAAFGLAALANLLVAGGMLASDIGHVPALLQQPEALQPRRLQALLGYELLRGLLLIGLIWLLAPLLAQVYTLPTEGTPFLRAMALSVLPLTLAIVPATLLERQLAYTSLAQIDVLQEALARVAAIIAALLGAGVWSFWVAALLGPLLRLALLPLALARLVPAAPAYFPPRWHTGELRAVIWRGGPIQLGSLSYLLREQLGTLLALLFYPLSDLGYLRWSQRLAGNLAQPISQTLGRVGLAALARIEQLAPARELAEQLLRGCVLLIWPLLALLSGLLPVLLPMLFGPHWLPALRSFEYLALATAGGEVLLLLNTIAVARQASSAGLRIMLEWTALQSGLALLAAALLGFEGVALAAALSIGWPLIRMARLLEQRLGLQLWPLLRAPLLAGLLIWGTARLLLPLATSLPAVCGVGLLSLSAGMAGLLLLEPGLAAQLRAGWQLLRGRP